jgi:hypothetical protein
MLVLNAGFQEFYNTQPSINKDRQREPQNLEDSIYALMQNMAHSCTDVLKRIGYSNR